MPVRTVESMSPEVVAEWAKRLLDADRDRRSTSPISDEHPEATIADAYAIQAEWARLRTAGGAQLVGRKIGATSEAIQRLFGVDQPDFGHLFDDMQVPDGGQVPLRVLIQPKVEGELAFVLKDDLSGPGVDTADVLACTEYVLPCIEIIDSRIDRWRIRLVDTIADNGSSGLFVLGKHHIDPYSPDLASIELKLIQSRVSVAEGSGKAVLGHPATAVAWLANALAPFGASLAKGSVVLSGAFATAVDARPGDSFVADFGPAGRVSCMFVE